MATTWAAMLHSIDPAIRELAKNADLTLLTANGNALIRNPGATTIEARVQLAPIRGTCSMDESILDDLRPAALVDTLAASFEDTAAKLRGSALVEYACGSWAMPGFDESDEMQREAMIQRLERASIRLMEQVQRLRKGNC